MVGHLCAAARGEAAEEDAVAVERAHADAVAEQRAAATAAGRVDGEDGDAQLVLLVEAQAADQLVGEARLAGAAGAGDAEDGHAAPAPRPRGCAVRASLVERPPSCAPVMARATAARSPASTASTRPGAGLPQVEVAVGDDGVDHAGEAEALAVLGAEDRDAGLAQPRDLLGDDDAAAAADDADVAGAVLLEQLHEVLEVLDVAALVGADARRPARPPRSPRRRPPGPSGCGRGG